MASRFGGEEFVLLLPQEDETAQQQRCEQIIRSLAAQDMHGIGITVSMGLVRCQHSWHFDTLFSQADRALSGQAGGQEPGLLAGASLAGQPASRGRGACA